MQQTDLLNCFATWPSSSSLAERGIIIGCSYHAEKLLPWWWYNYSQYNHYPVAFVDFGMSNEAKAWCKKKGIFLELDIPDSFITKEKDICPKLLKIWHDNYAGNLDDARKHWFKKPLAMIYTPFLHTIWIDIDCEINGSLEKLFSLDGKTTNFACRPESDLIQKEHEKLTLKKPGEQTYNSGVVVFQHGCEIIKEWCRQTILNNHLFIGDQDILSHVLYEKKPDMIPLPYRYNWIISHSNHYPESTIYHWVGHIGKKIIFKKAAFLTHLNLLESF